MALLLERNPLSLTELSLNTVFNMISAWRTASSQQGDLRLSGPPSSQDDDDGARTRNRRVPADFRADSLATEPPTPKLFGPRQIRTRA
ncbi:hypothetical protein PoB_002289200 [Plakobranchus ocellatus]|uniref:Uncharacterized protein n=1 Tax=Plakobranchus ocellatus TaxID=259542 RepID=A0AAV3ZP03_9GAST|nr:hypothetical protein PoB_002289200 [Plakobranchus ocellatus]